MTPKEDYYRILGEIYDHIEEVFATRYGRDDGEPRYINYHILTHKLCEMFLPFTFNNHLYVRDITQDEEIYCREDHLVRRVIQDIFMNAANHGLISKYATYAKERRELFEMVIDYNVVTRNPFNKPQKKPLYDGERMFTLKDGVNFEAVDAWVLDDVWALKTGGRA